MSTPSSSTIESLRPVFRQRLNSMYSGEHQIGNAGPIELDKITRISAEQGLWIYDTCRQLKPKRTLEIGMAYGFSTIFFLAAIDQIGAGFHTAVDPFQSEGWHGIGAHQVHQLGMEKSFCLIEDFGVHAMARFKTQKDQFELIYIDGSHRFDDVLVDFTLAADLCPLGGHIILDDMWMRSIQVVDSWIRSNRKDFRSVTTPIPNISQFERIGPDKRNWDHFVEFYPLQNGQARQGSLLGRIANRFGRAVTPGDPAAQ